MKKTAFRRVVAEAERWGIQVLFEPLTESPNVLYPAPFHRAHLSSYIHGPGLVCAASPVITWDDKEDADLAANGLCHELVHAIVWQRTGLKPMYQSDLFNLALEKEIVWRLRLPWGRWGDLIQVTHKRNLHQVSDRVRAGIVATSLALMEDYGLMIGRRATFEHRYSEDMKLLLDKVVKRRARRFRDLGLKEDE